MDTAKALAEARAAKSELLQTDAWKQYGTKPTTHTYKCGQHLDAAIAALQPDPAPTPAPAPAPTPMSKLVGVSNNLTGGGNRQHVLDLGVKLIREDRPSQTVVDWAHGNGIKVIGIMYGATSGLIADIVEGDNEPYNSSSWDVVGWAGKMLACAKAAKQAGKTFLLPVGPPWNNGNVNVNGTWRDCVAAISAAQPSIWQYVDGISIHPYSQPNDPSVRTPILDKWRTNLATVGHGGIPFWCTEFGWPTGGTTWPGGTYTEQAQADYYTKFMATIGARPDVAALVPYRLDDFGSRDSDSEHWFGLIDPSGRRKLAWSVVQQLAANP